MAVRRLETGDEVTDFNLRRLEHLSKNDAHGGEVRLFEIHIHATIDSLEMLPAAVRRHFRCQTAFNGDPSSAPNREPLWFAPNAVPLRSMSGSRHWRLQSTGGVARSHWGSAVRSRRAHPSGWF